jgi:hypothetical protein
MISMNTFYLIRFTLRRPYGESHLAISAMPSRFAVPLPYSSMRHRLRPVQCRSMYDICEVSYVKVLKLELIELEKGRTKGAQWHKHVSRCYTDNKQQATFIMQSVRSHTKTDSMPLILVSIESHTPMIASVAGTNEPVCARYAMMPTCLRYTDLPAIERDETIEVRSCYGAIACTH